MARAGGPTALASPMGVSWAGTATAPAHARPAGAEHRWVTGLYLPGTRSHTRLVSRSPPARGDPLVTAALDDRRGAQRAQAGDEAALPHPRSAHRPPTPRAAEGTGRGVGDDTLGHGCRGEIAAAHGPRRQHPCALDHQGHCTLLPGLRAVLQHPHGMSLRPQRQARAAALARGLGVDPTRQHGPSPDRSDPARGPVHASVPVDQ
jgi:hypothetical protein